MDQSIDLRTYIAETLKQTLEGVKENQDYVKSIGGEINPHFIYGIVGDKGFYSETTRDQRCVQFIEFDIAIGSGISKETKGGVGIFVSPISLGGQSRNEQTSNFMNRIKFSVPVLFPIT